MVMERRRNVSRKQRQTKAAPPKPRRSNSKATMTKGRGSSKSGCTSKVRGSAPAQPSRKSSKAVTTKASKAKVDSRAKKTTTGQVLKRPARANSAPDQSARWRPEPAARQASKGVKRSASSGLEGAGKKELQASAPVQALRSRLKELGCPIHGTKQQLYERLCRCQATKRPARARSAEVGSGGFTLTLEALSAHTEAHMQPSDREKFDKPMDMDVESVVTMAMSQWAMKRPAAANSYVLGSLYNPTSFASPAYPVAAQKQPRIWNKRASEASQPPKSWNPPTVEASLQKRRVDIAKSRPRLSTSSNGLLGDNLDELLPSGDDLRLKANVPGECLNRAQQRRVSASRDLRCKAGLAPTAAQSEDRRPPASPTRNRAPGAHNPARTLSRAASWAPAPEMGEQGAAPVTQGMAPVTPGATTERMEEAMLVAGRILDIRKQRFASKVEWGFTVLDNPFRDVLSVQKAYRALMRPLHPDRAGTQLEVAAAVDVLREAKDLCERALRQQNPPARPNGLKSTHLCTVAGRRRFKVTWRAPESRENAPVHRYIVAVYDPSYGKALNVGTLEPDYNQELGRYLAYDDPDLCSYVISEEDLRKMPNLFKSPSINVQVAAANNEGQSDWSILRVSNAVARTTSTTPPVRVAPPSGAHPPPPSSRTSLPGSGAASQPTISQGAPPRRLSVSTMNTEESHFNRCVDKKSGSELGIWLQHQKKEFMQSWLKRRSQQVSGSKELMIERMIKFKGENPW